MRTARPPAAAGGAGRAAAGPGPVTRMPRPKPTMARRARTRTRLTPAGMPREPRISRRPSGRGRRAAAAAGPARPRTPRNRRPPRDRPSPPRMAGRRTPTMPTPPTGGMVTRLPDAGAGVSAAAVRPTPSSPPMTRRTPWSTSASRTARPARPAVTTCGRSRDRPGSRPRSSGAVRAGKPAAAARRSSPSPSSWPGASRSSGPWWSASARTARRSRCWKTACSSSTT